MILRNVLCIGAMLLLFPFASYACDGDDENDRRREDSGDCEENSYNYSDSSDEYVLPNVVVTGQRQTPIDYGARDHQALMDYFNEQMGIPQPEIEGRRGRRNSDKSEDKQEAEMSCADYASEIRSDCYSSMDKLEKMCWFSIGALARVGIRLRLPKEWRSTGTAGAGVGVWATCENADDRADAYCEALVDGLINENCPNGTSRD